MWALSRQSFKLRYLINKTKKKAALFAKYYLLNLDKNKNDRFWRHRKKNTFFAFRFFTELSLLQNQKSVLTVRFNPYSSLEVTFFVLIRFPGRATAFCSCASWPYLDFQHHDCIACWEMARIFDTVRSFSHSCSKNRKSI